jgi:hypothetical protein
MVVGQVALALGAIQIVRHRRRARLAYRGAAATVGG